MSSDINRCVFTGRLTWDAELKATASGADVLKFSLAVNDRRNVNGEWAEVPNYVDCVMFGNRARAIADFMSKGMRVCVDGKLRQSSWEKDGKRQSKIEIAADDVVLLSPKNGGNGAKNDSMSRGFDNQAIGEVYSDEAIPF